MKSIQEEILKELFFTLSKSKVFTKEEIDQFKSLGKQDKLSNQKDVEDLIKVQIQKDENSSN